MKSHSRARIASGTSILSVFAVIAGSLFASAPAHADDSAKPPAPLVMPNALKAPATGKLSGKTTRFVVKFSDAAKMQPSAVSNALGDAAKKSGLSVKEVKETTGGKKIVSADHKLSAAETQSMVDSLKSQPGVQYVEEDSLFQPTLEPNDAYLSYQWDMTDPSTGLNLPGVWDKTTGTGQVVAVVDTGILPHGDLDANVLPGYDMINDPAVSRDGDGRDANARDEGDYRVPGDCGDSGSANSSWHGTHVAGTIAAVGNNGIGVTGVAPGAKIVPIRALGMCGGYMSDISDAIIWASGGDVPGVPVNPNPAKIINLSLAGEAMCPVTAQAAIDDAVSHGASIFVAAGNAGADAANYTPANCNNVVTVGASGRNGNRAYYSNYGANVDITAPGGDSAGYILSTYNTGTTTPGSDAYAELQGTSMATPHAAGVAALILSTNPSMGSGQLESLMKSTASPLTVDCPEGCGAGLVNPAAAVSAAEQLSPDPAVTSAVPTITGDPVVGSVLSADPGAWGPESVALSYQWLRNGVAITGATASTYTLAGGDFDTSVAVRVTGRMTGYTTLTSISSGTAPVAVGTLSTNTPTITGAAKVGSALTAVAGLWGPAPVTFAYQWMRSGVAVPGATTSTYVQTTNDLGKVMSVRVTGTATGFTTVALDSAATAAVAAVPVVGTVPKIIGTVRVGVPLTASPGAWGPAPVTLAYQWYRNSVAISGAYGVKYTPTSADMGKRMTVRVTGTKTGYISVAKTSGVSAVVAAGIISSYTPAIYGTRRVSNYLTAKNTAWGPAPVSMRYQWYRNGAPIYRANYSRYYLTGADRGRYITVKEAGVKSGYTTAYRISAATRIA